MTYTSKKYLIAIVVSLFAFAAWAGGFPDSECDNTEGNMILNCGWETNCWAGWHPGGELLVDIGRDGTAHSGDYYGLIHTNPNYLWLGQQYLPTTPGQTYTLSFWMRNFEPVDFIQVAWNDDGIEQTVFDLENIPVQTEWTQIVIPNLTAATDNTSIYWSLGNAQGDLHLDDVELTPQN
jgi:hypothetical protein